MSDYDICYMRSVVINKYRGLSWRRKVESMSDNQVMAIFYSFLNRETKKKPIRKNIVIHAPDEKTAMMMADKLYTYLCATYNFKVTYNKIKLEIQTCKCNVLYLWPERPKIKIYTDVSINVSNHVTETSWTAPISYIEREHKK